MADRYSRQRTHELFGDAGCPLEHRAWQLLLTLADAACPQAEAELARRCGISAQRVSELLLESPSQWVVSAKRQGSTYWCLSPALVSRLSGKGPEIQEELARLNGRLRLERRPVGRPKGKEAQDTLERAWQLVQGQHPTDGITLLEEANLSLGSLLAVTHPRERDEVRARYGVVAVQALMNAGRAQAAVKAASPFLRTPEKGPPDQIAHILASTAAAYRMLPGGVRQAVGLLDRAILLSKGGALPADRLRSWLRWFEGLKSTYSAVAGDWQHSVDSLGASKPFVLSEEEFVETSLYEIRILLQQNRRHEAERLLDRCRPLLAHVPLWLRGWFPRFEADLRAGGTPAVTLHATPWSGNAAVLHFCLQGWQACSTIGFQQLLLLARVAAIRATREDEEGAVAMAPDVSMQATLAEALQGMRRYVAILHRQGPLKRRPSECVRCQGAALGEVAAHALGANFGPNYASFLV